MAAEARVPPIAPDGGRLRMRRRWPSTIFKKNTKIDRLFFVILFVRLFFVILFDYFNADDFAPFFHQ